MPPSRSAVFIATSWGEPYWIGYQSSLIVRSMSTSWKLIKVLVLPVLPLKLPAKPALSAAIWSLITELETSPTVASSWMTCA